MKLCAYLPTDDAPFTGERQMIPRVRVRLKFLPERYFAKTSMLGESRAEHLERMKSDGVQLNKTYEAIRINGYGDVADITTLKDSGEEKSFMEFLFSDAD